MRTKLKKLKSKKTCYVQVRHINHQMARERMGSGATLKNVKLNRIEINHT